MLGKFRRIIKIFSTKTHIQYPEMNRPPSHRGTLQSLDNYLQSTKDSQILDREPRRWKSDTRIEQTFFLLLDPPQNQSPFLLAARLSRDIQDAVDA